MIVEFQQFLKRMILEWERRLILMDFLQPKVWQLVIFDPTTVYCTSKQASRMGLADGNTFEVT